MEVSLQPRYIRAGQAPAYCGMNRDLFAQEIRPYLTEIPIGVQGIAFDRIDLDVALDEYKARRGRAPAQTWSKDTWQHTRVVSASEAEFGTSTRGKRESQVADFEKALGRATGQRRKSI